jgi:hypothetical protein
MIFDGDHYHYDLLGQVCSEALHSELHEYNPLLVSDQFVAAPLRKIT